MDNLTLFFKGKCKKLEQLPATTRILEINPLLVHFVLLNNLLTTEVMC